MLNLQADLLLNLEEKLNPLLLKLELDSSKSSKTYMIQAQAHTLILDRQF